MVEDQNQPDASVQVDAEGNEEAPVARKVFSEEMHEKVSVALQKALCEEDATVPFQGDLENPVYLNILACIRAFNPESYPDPVVEGENALEEGQ